MRSLQASAHKVSLIALHAGGLEVNPAVGPEKVESSAGLIRETARQAIEDLREVLGVLRTDLSQSGADLAPVPRAADLARLVEASRAAGVQVTSSLTLPDEVPALVGRTVYRVVQEGLTNVHKHARGVSTEVLSSAASCAPAGQLPSLVSRRRDVGVRAAQGHQLINRGVARS